LSTKRDGKQKEARMLYDDDPPEALGAIDDERLRLIFTCCHPALAMETRVALTLRMVGGLTVPEIARAFLVQEATMGQRITRAKAKIKAARIPYRVPSAEDRDRVPDVDRVHRNGPGAPRGVGAGGRLPDTVAGSGDPRPPAKTQ
jgi:predicted RNA polymerase sigma factor